MILLDATLGTELGAETLKLERDKVETVASHLRCCQLFSLLFLIPSINECRGSPTVLIHCHHFRSSLLSSILVLLGHL